MRQTVKASGHTEDNRKNFLDIKVGSLDALIDSLDTDKKCTRHPDRECGHLEKFSTEL